MPVNFLTEDQRRRCGRSNAVPDETQLGGFFHLDADARRRAMAAHGPRNQLGWAVQLGTARFLGRFLVDPTDVPAAVATYVAAQLGLDAAQLKGYGDKQARWDHQAQIRELYDCTTFGRWQWFALARWLYMRAWLAGERPSVLFDLATYRLVQARVLLPGVSVLERLVAGVRERTAGRQFRLLAAVPTTTQLGRYNFLLPDDVRNGQLRPLRTHHRSDSSPSRHSRVAASVTAVTIRRTCSCDTPATSAIRRRPQPSSRAEIIAETNAAEITPSSTARSSATTPSRIAGARSTSAPQNRSTSARRNTTRSQPTPQASPSHSGCQQM